MISVICIFFAKTALFTDRCHKIAIHFCYWNSMLDISKRGYGIIKALNSMKSIFDFLGLTNSKQEENVGKSTENDKKENNSGEKAENTETEQKQQIENVEKEKGNKAHIYNLIIVDESGSMSHLRESTLSGINETIQTIRSSQEEYAETQEHRLTLVTFSTRSYLSPVRTIIDNQPILDVKEFERYKPDGCTPLYDAMGQSLTQLHQNIKDDEDATAVVTVLTDGLENSSKEWNAYRLRRLIEQLKEEGWSFSYMGSAHKVKEVTDLLSIDNVVEFSHDNLGSDNTWRRERSSKMAYYEKMDRLYSMNSNMSSEEKRMRKCLFASEYYSQRVTPDHIEELKENEIFVFGSNANGIHNGGAAKQALSRFGAIQGQKEGLQGKSYAIPTTEGLNVMKEAIKHLTTFVKEHPQSRFLVTKIGCGSAGYRPSQIAPLFEDCITLENVYLPNEFWECLGLKMSDFD